MLKKYTPEEFQKLYKKLPQDLQEAMWSEETSDHIYNICERNEIEENSMIAKLVGRVLVGILLPKEFQQVLMEELKLDVKKAKEIAWEVDRFIFRPVRPFLEKLYKTEETEFLITPSVQEISKTKKETEADKYREQI